MGFNLLDPIDTLQGAPQDLEDNTLTAAQKAAKIKAQLDAHNAAINATANAESFVPRTPGMPEPTGPKLPSGNFVSNPVDDNALLKQKLQAAINQPQASYSGNPILDAQLLGLPKGVPYGAALEGINKIPVMQDMQNNLQQQKDLYAGELAKPSQVDLSAPAALLDSWYGGNLSKSITKPEDRTQLRAALQKQIESGEQGFSDQQRKYLNDVLHNQVQGLNPRGASMLDRLVFKAQDSVLKNPIIQALQTGKNQADRGLEILQDPKTTVQDFNSALQDYEKAIAGSGTASDTKLALNAYSDAKADWARTLSKYGLVGTEDVQIRPEIRQHVLENFQRLIDNINLHMEDQANKIASSAKNINYAPAANTMREAAGQFKVTKKLYNPDSKSSEAQAQGTQRHVTADEIKAYADQSFKGDQAKAKEFLKGKGYATD